MPRSSINQASVHQVCDEVYIITGKDPLYEDIQRVLGGSNSTIKPYLHSWLEKARPARFPLPDAVGVKASHLVQVIWVHAVAAARQLVEVNEKKREEAVAVKEKELDVAMQEICSIEVQRDRFAASVDSLIAERAELKVRLGELEQLKTQLQASQAAERTMRDQRDEDRAELNLARGQIQAMQRQIEQLLPSSQAQYVKARRPRNGHRPSAEPAS